MSPIARATKAALVTVAAVPAVTKAAWKHFGTTTWQGALSFGRAWSSGLRVVWGAHFGISYARLARLAFQNPVAARGLRLIAQAAAEAPVYLEHRKGSAWEPVESASHGDVLEVLDRPGPRTTRESAFLAMVAALYCGGEFWVEKTAVTTGPNKGVRRLRFIMPDEFQRFTRDEAGEVTGYVFRRRWRSKPYTLDVAECLHVRLFNPLDDDHGLAVLVGSADQMDHMAKATAWNASIAEGGGRVPGYWKPEGLPPGKHLKKDQVEAAQEQFDAAREELAHRNVEKVLSGAFERVAGDVSPKDADWIKGLTWDLRMIAAVLGVDPALLGDVKGGSLTDAGVDSAVRALYLLTVLPLLSFVYAELSAFLLPAGVRLAVDTDQIPALSEDMDAKAERFRGLYTDGVLGLEETRTAIGHDPKAPDDLRRPAPAVPPSDPPARPADPEEDEEDLPVIRFFRSLSETEMDEVLSRMAA